MNFVQPELGGSSISIIDTLKGGCLVAMVFLPGALILYGLPQTAFTVFASLGITIAILCVFSTLVSWATGGRATR